MNAPRSASLIFNLRSTGGGGKSHIAHRILADFDHKVVPGVHLTERARAKQPEPRVLGYRVDFDPLAPAPLYVVGDYGNVCGGCDGIPTYDEVQARVRKFAGLGHVLFEGYLISTVYERWANMARAFGDRWVFAFMDTPLETCLERVRQRRLSRMTGYGTGDLFGKEPEVAAPKRTERTYHVVRRARARLIESGFRVFDYPHDAEPAYGPLVTEARRMEAPHLPSGWQW